MQTRNFVAGASGAALLVGASMAQAAIDVTAVVTEIGLMSAPIAAIGAAALLIFVGLKTWKLIRRAL